MWRMRAVLGLDPSHWSSAMNASFHVIDRSLHTTGWTTMVFSLLSPPNGTPSFINSSLNRVPLQPSGATTYMQFRASRADVHSDPLTEDLCPRPPVLLGAARRHDYLQTLAIQKARVLSVCSQHNDFRPLNQRQHLRPSRWCTKTTSSLFSPPLLAHP
ncbi:hypothetical protein GALMADRAFT_1141263 [Galerina marginata CBS 339.88]|uniref:Uncharacterized protein n=1 Tax=Galerina marginata (strain CBS 339.88) TaxID=685588 RepID=A0A067SGE7_GALM3|nr:hypothetical protein GALMADRAFT_1141263 [Galerina marginata CBS 339.88]